MVIYTCFKRSFKVDEINVAEPILKADNPEDLPIDFGLNWFTSRQKFYRNVLTGPDEFN